MRRSTRVPVPTVFACRMPCVCSEPQTPLSQASTNRISHSTDTGLAAGTRQAPGRRGRRPAAEGTGTPPRCRCYLGRAAHGRARPRAHASHPSPRGSTAPARRLARPQYGLRCGLAAPDATRGGGGCPPPLDAFVRNSLGISDPGESKSGQVSPSGSARHATRVATRSLACDAGCALHGTRVQPDRCTRPAAAVPSGLQRATARAACAAGPGPCHCSGRSVLTAPRLATKVAIDHAQHHAILKCAMYNKLDEMREIVISDPRAILAKEVRPFSVRSPRFCRAWRRVETLSCDQVPQGHKGP